MQSNRPATSAPGHAASAMDLIERVTDAFFALDRDWHFTYVNGEAERVLLRSRQELLGESIWEAFPEAVESTFWHEYHRALDSGDMVQFTEYYPPLETWFEVRAYPSPDGLSVYFRNVNEQRRLEEMLRRSRRQLATVAENASFGLIMMDERHHCTYMNPAAEKLTGYTTAEVSDRPLHDYVHHTRPDGSPFPIDECPIDRALPERMRESGEDVFVHRDGHFYPVAFTASPIVEDGQPIGTVIELRDITLEKRAREDTAMRDREAALAIAVGEALTAAGSLEDVLQHCVEAVVQNLDAAFARVWTLNESEQMLELRASAGLYTHIDGPHGRVPVGMYKIGKIAEEREPHLTNDVLNDPRVSDKAWARREGMVAVAGYPLLVEDRLVGVLALFARMSLRDRTLNALAAVADGIASTIQRKQGEAELERERRRILEVFHRAPAAVAVTEGADHTITVANPLFHRLLGPHRTLLGQPVRSALPDLEGQGFFELLDSVYESGEAYEGSEMPALLDRGDGAGPMRSYFNFVYQPLLGLAGRTRGIMIHAVEVTEQVQARREVEQRADELARLARELESTNAELDQFAYVASHDLKAPLRGIANLTQWIEEDTGDALSDESREHLQLLHGRVQRMESLIDGILTYSRAGRVRESTEWIDTATLVAESTELLALPESVTLDVQPGLPRVRAERTPFQQVFLNLISNAAKFSAAYRPDPRIEVRWGEEPDAWTFTVRDNGPGIAPEYHDRVWGIFQTLEARDKVEGTGVGLSVVKKIVESRGGSITLDSAAGAGATFTFTWPKTSTQSEDLG